MAAAKEGMAAAGAKGGMAAAAAPGGSSWRQRFWVWWQASLFQQTWARLALQTGVCTLLVMAIFSHPSVWLLHSYDPVLANPVLVLVIANLALLFTVNTGLPAFKIALESVLGCLAGGVCVYGVAYAAYGINGGSHEPSMTKAAIVLLFGALVLLLGTASRFRWPQYVALAALIFNLTVAVGLAVTYLAKGGLWRFVLYWWWFIGLAVIFTMAVATFVLPLPTGWAVRKHLARALRQEGAVLDAIVQLLTAENPADGIDYGPGSSGASRGGADDPFADEAGGDGGGASSAAGLGGLYRLATAPLGRLALSRKSSRRDVHSAAAAMGINPDMYAAVEPIYTMSGPASASLQAAHAHTRYTHYEIDVYRPTHIFPLLAFQRLVLMARTMLSSAMMMLYPLQTGRARLGTSREHAGHLRQVSAEVKACCECLAAIVRDNAPAGPALQQLERLESAFWVLQQGVGAAANGAAHSHMAAAGRAAAQEAVEQLMAAEGREGGGGGSSGGGTPHQSEGQQQQEGQAKVAAGADMAGADGAGAEVAGADVAGADVAEDSLALHLSLSMLFTCCTRVRSMYLLLPQLLGQDQQGVNEVVSAHFATAHTWDAVLRARTHVEPASPRSAREVFRRSQMLWGSGGSSGGKQGMLKSSRSSAALSKLVRPTVQVAETVVTAAPVGGAQKALGGAQRAVAAIEKATGFSRGQLSLGLQMAVSFVAAMFLVIVPAVNQALGGRAVWALFIIVVVHEPLLGSVIWKCVLRFGGTVMAGLLGLGALYFTVLCNGMSFENRPAKFVAMTAALVVLTMPLAAGTAKYGLQNAYFWIVSCLIMYTVALPGYAEDHPRPILALWRIACTAIGLAIELVAAVVVFPVTARSAAHAVAAGALRSMADVADMAFHSVLPAGADSAAAAAAAAVESPRHSFLPRRFSRDGGGGGGGGGGGSTEGSAHGDRRRSLSVGRQSGPSAEPATIADALTGFLVPSVHDRQQQDPAAVADQQGPVHTKQPRLISVVVQGSPRDKLAQQQQQGQQQAHHVAITCTAGGWHGNEIATGPVLTRIHRPMMETYGRTSIFRALLVPLRVEYHPFKQPHRFPIGPGRRAQRLLRRMLNVLTTFAIAMDSHHTESVPLLAPHAAELEGLIGQLREALRALAAMVSGTVTLEGAAGTVAALEQHAQHLMLRVLLSGPPESLSTTDATQGLAFLAMLFNVTSVARLLCLSLGESFCAADTEGQAAAAALLRDATRWAADDKLMAVAAELMSEALASNEDELVPAESRIDEVATAQREESR